MSVCQMVEATFARSVIEAPQASIWSDLRIDHSTNNLEVAGQSLIRFSGGSEHTNPFWPDGDCRAPTTYPDVARMARRR